MRRKLNHGFTLVELLAVIVLLGILVTLSFPKILEMVDREKDEINQAKLSLIYTGAKSYLFDHSNQYPEREGNIYCISPKTLEDENYVAFDTSEMKQDYVVKISYFSEDEYELSYVKESACKSTGAINSELAGLTCTIDKTGYSVDKKVTVTYPSGENFIYQYSLDEGKSWKEVTNFDSGNKLFFHFKTTGSVLAKVTMSGESGGSLSCSAYVEQMDPTPIGTIIAYAGTSIPQGYLLADGSAVMKSRFEELYDLIGTTYGVPGNSKVFYLPNLQGRTVVGAGTGSDLALGYAGGEKTHILTVDELPSHTHTFNAEENQISELGGSHTHNYTETVDENGTHTHPIANGENILSIGSTEAIGPFTGGLVENGDFLQDRQLGHMSLEKSPTHAHSYAGTTASANTTHTHTFTATGKNETAGEGGAHNNLMPYYTINYMIKYQ